MFNKYKSFILLKKIIYQYLLDINNLLKFQKF